MFSLLKINKNLLIYIILFLIFIPLLGLNFIFTVLGNILLVIILIPILLFLLALISFNSFKSKFTTCEACGSISLGLTDKCLNCGADLKKNNSEILIEASESTVEIKAEEIQ